MALTDSEVLQEHLAEVGTMSAGDTKLVVVVTIGSLEAEVVMFWWIRQEFDAHNRQVGAYQCSR